MFDRAFFEQHFREQTKAFAREHKLASPVVEFVLDDGTVLYVQSVIQTRENWLCLIAHDEDATRQVYCPYYSIKRITLYPGAPKPTQGRDVTFRLG